MKANKNPDKGPSDFSIQLKKHFSDDEIASIILVLSDISDVGHRFIFKEVSQFMKLPAEIKASVVSHVSFYRLMSSVARRELPSDFALSSLLPTCVKDWPIYEDFEESFIFIVKDLYEGLKSEGKV